MNPNRLMLRLPRFEDVLLVVLQLHDALSDVVQCPVVFLLSWSLLPFLWEPADAQSRYAAHINYHMREYACKLWHVLLQK